MTTTLRGGPRGGSPKLAKLREERAGKHVRGRRRSILLLMSSLTLPRKWKRKQTKSTKMSAENEREEDDEEEEEEEDGLHSLIPAHTNYSH